MKINRDCHLPRLFFLLWLWTFALVAASGWPPLWGFVPLGLWEGGWVILAALVSTAVLFGAGEGVMKSAGSRLARLWRRLYQRPGQHATLFFLYACVLLAGWTFRSRNHFMGDGWFYISEVEKPFKFLPSRPLDFFIHQLFHRLVESQGLGNGETAYALLHCLLLPLFLWVCWRIAKLVAGDALERTALAIVLATTANLQLFVGYVESYTLLNLWTAFYIWAGISFLANRAKERPWKLTLFFLLAAFSHRSGLALMPSLIFIWLEVLFPPEKSARFFKPWIAVASFSALFYIILIAGVGSPLFITLENPTPDSDIPYSLLSLSHIGEKLNFLLLISPVALLALPVIAVRGWPIKQLKSPWFIFLLWASGSCALFSFILNPMFGVRDWDLLSLPGLPLALLAGWSLLNVLQGRFRRTFLCALALASAAHGLAWIHVNADEHRGLRFLHRIRTEDLHTVTGKLNLGYMLQEKNHLDQALAQYRLVTGRGTKNASLNMSDIFILREQPDSALTLCSDLFTSYFDSREAVRFLMILSVAHEIKESPDSALNYFLMLCEKKLELDDNQRSWWLDRIEKVRQHFDQVLKTRPSDTDALVFFLRYHVIARNEEMQDSVYNYILEADFPLPTWTKLIQFTEYCGGRDRLAEMIEKAIEQHPDAFQAVDPGSGGR